MSLPDEKELIKDIINIVNHIDEFYNVTQGYVDYLLKKFNISGQGSDSVLDLRVHIMRTVVNNQELFAHYGITPAHPIGIFYKNSWVIFDGD